MKPAQLSDPSQPNGSKSNRSIVDRYDTLVTRVQERVDTTNLSEERSFLGRLIDRLNIRGRRELERRHRQSEEELWKESLLPPKQKPKKWL